ncbi:hypothetical protein [Nocardioides allogilvus]|uniref:hypothetical protein n=1 Tax=Nocardioides allogilvus TaxID=2072017 RepID=UPI000D2FCF38|nr:hypothetical protein [Nocardioides allogilvus]
MRAPRLYVAVLAVALVAAAGCSAEVDGVPPDGVAPSAEPTSVASGSKAWVADVRVRPNWIGRDAPWIWEYSDDVVVIAPRGLVALDQETGAEVWRLPLGGQVCGATPVPSKLGLVAITVGRCEPAGRPTRAGMSVLTGEPATARRTTVKAVDLESASVVWERPFPGAPTLEVGGEALLVAGRCSARRFDLGTGAPLGPLAAGCDNQVLVRDGVVVVSSAGGGPPWRAVEVTSGETVAEVTVSDPFNPLRILAGQPLTVLAADTADGRSAVVRLEPDGVRELADVSTEAQDAFVTATDESVVLAGEAWPGATELSLDDGSTLGGFPGVGAERWIPFARLDGGVLGFEGTQEGLNAGRGRLTLRSLRDDSLTELDSEVFLNDTNLAVAAPKAVVIDDVLLMPSHGNGGVLAHRLTLPAVS